MGASQVVHSAGFFSRTQPGPLADDPTNAIVLHLERRPDALVLRVEGRLVAERLEALEVMLNQMWAEPTAAVAVDLSACSVLDPAALAALNQAQDRARTLKREFVLSGFSRPD